MSTSEKVINILNGMHPKSREYILRTVREQQKQRLAPLKADHPRKKSVRILTLEALAKKGNGMTRDQLYQYIFRITNAKPFAKKKIENNININLHTLAKSRLVKKEKERGGKFKLTPQGREFAIA